MYRACLILLVASLVSCLASALVAQELAGDSEASALCSYSKPSEGDDDEAARRNVERRKVLHQRFSVTVDAENAPVIGYDEVTGLLTVNAYRPLAITPTHAVVVDETGALPFEVTAESASDVISRYVTGQARLRLEFVPAPFADAEQSICTRGESADKHLIHVALLRASIVDQLGRTLVGFDTALGREVQMLEANNIAGFLASAHPQVTVASVSFYDGKPSYPRTTPKVPDQLKAEISAHLQKRVYGCYVRGLASNGRLQGALVVRFDAARKSNATVMVDSLNSPAVSGCVLDRLGEVGLALSQRYDVEKSLKATIIFKLQDNSL